MARLENLRNLDFQQQIWPFLSHKSISKQKQTQSHYQQNISCKYGFLISPIFVGLALFHFKKYQNRFLFTFRQKSTLFCMVEKTP